MTPVSTDPAATVAALPVTDPGQVRATTVLGVCCSLKPATATAGRSAARTLLVAALSRLSAVYRDVRMLDLRDHPVPMFDGRLPEDIDDPHLRFCASCVRAAGALLLSVPAYWCGVSGVFKNFIDVLCGPAYDLPEPVSPVFAGRPVGLLIVGADPLSADRAAGQAADVMESVGALVQGSPVVAADVRADRPATELLSSLVVIGGQLAMAVHRNGAGGG